MKLSEDQGLALEAMERGESVFLTGGAGTGKTALVNEFVRRKAGKSIARLASTGAAAQLIGGQTLHSFFGLGIDIHMPHNTRVPERLKQKIKATKTFIIEEISMARIDHFQAIRDRLFGSAKGYGPFAGYQLIVVGDFAQLPPVLPEAEMKVIEELYGEGSQYAFQSRYWAGLGRHELTTVHRQAADREFAGWLNVMRSGEIPDLDYINARIGAADGAATHLVATNRAADVVNADAMARLPGGHYKIEGEVRNNFSDRNMRVPTVLRLKPGSRVIICANNPQQGYVNGSTGVLVNCSRAEDGKPVATVNLDDGRQVRVVQAVWENVSYGLGPDGIQKNTLGAYRQLPLMPGWAITIHRAQGMSLDRLHVDPRGIFEAGQAYVALSRATSLRGLSLAAEIRPEHLIINERVRGFMREAGQDVTPVFE